MCMKCYIEDCLIVQAYFEFMEVLRILCPTSNLIVMVENVISIFILTVPITGRLSAILLHVLHNSSLKKS